MLVLCRINWQNKKYYHGLSSVTLKVFSCKLLLVAEQYNLVAAIDVGCEADGHTSNAVLNNRLLESYLIVTLGVCK